EDLAIELLQQLDLSFLAAALLRDPGLTERVTPSVSGVVTRATIERMIGPLGIQTGWIACVDVRRNARAHEGVLQGSDGSLYPVEGVLSVEDMPFDDNGEPFDVVVEVDELPDGSLEFADRFSDDAFAVHAGM
ncbi:MAG TPA: hypothetical protein VFV99_14105, partial [Kofleriaceae bacterium]|nr:hypothetical protein [Kofleriaceae bacterium]